ncbi:hypothetical protein DENIT_80463 [Pseudomonas veronii]|nr:hypothetical protein DENIT_80463 [Pseudomonas veronii]
MAFKYSTRNFGAAQSGHDYFPITRTLSTYYFPRILKCLVLIMPPIRT